MNEASIFLINKRNDKYIDIPEFPDDIFVDSSFILRSYGKTKSETNEQRECREFIEYCNRNSTNLYVTNDIYVEVEEVIQRNLTEQLYKQTFNKDKYPDNMGQKQAHEILMQRLPNFIDIMEKEVAKAQNFIDEIMINLEYDNNIQLREDINKLKKMTGYSVNKHDIRHILVAHLYGINSIATLDVDFAKFDNLNIFTTQRENMKSARMGRANILLPFEEGNF